MSNRKKTTATQNDWLARNLILITGKGGVGKTTVARSVARHLAAQGKRTLLCNVLQIAEQEQKLEKRDDNLWEITLNSHDCFREYIILKVKLKSLYTLFLGNKITQYLQRAAPGVKEMVLLGKIWFERNNYDHVVVDMPSMGYALTMLHTPFNFAALFPGGPIYNDANEMIATFADPATTSFVVVSLAEEMPVQESLELAEELKGLVPANPAHLVLNRLVRVPEEAKKLHAKKFATLSTQEAASPLWRGVDYLIQKEEAQQKQFAQLKKTFPQWIEIDEVRSERGNEIESLIQLEQHHGG